MADRTAHPDHHPPDDAPDLVDDLGPIGGQALLEGVMMRRAGAWGAAVRQLDGTITTTAQRLPSDGTGVRTVPLLRGPVALWDSISLGTRATLWSAQARGTEDGKGYSKVGLALTTVVATVIAVTVLGVAPAVVPKALGIEGRWLFNAVESLLRLAVLVGYMALLTLSPQVKRTFAYHGAEHMTIHAFEHGVDLVPDQIRRFDRRHPRCGTAFLLVVIVVALLVHVAIGEVSWPVLVASRVLGLPVIAALAYEVVRFAGTRRHTRLGRVLMAPGSWLQGLTTRPPDDDQIEVAVAALRATLAAEAVPLGTPSSTVAAGAPS